MTTYMAISAMSSCVLSEPAKSPSPHRLSKIRYRHTNPQLSQKQNRIMIGAELHRIDHNAVVIQDGFQFLKLPFEIFVLR